MAGTSSFFIYGGVEGKVPEISSDVIPVVSTTSTTILSAPPESGNFFEGDFDNGLLEWVKTQSGREQFSPNLQIIGERFAGGCVYTQLGRLQWTPYLHGICGCIYQHSLPKEQFGQLAHCSIG